MSTATQKVFLPAIFTCSHITFAMVYSFYFLCFGSRRNEFNSLWEGLRGRRQKATTTQKVCLPAIFTCSHITFAMVYSFYFLFVGFRRNEFNSLWEGLRGRHQMSTVAQKVCLPAIFTCSHITFAMVYSFYFLFVGSRRNECNSTWERDGEEIRRLLLTRKMYHPEDYFLSLTSRKEKGLVILQKIK